MFSFSPSRSSNCVQKLGAVSFVVKQLFARYFYYYYFLFFSSSAVIDLYFPSVCCCCCCCCCLFCFCFSLPFILFFIDSFFFSVGVKHQVTLFYFSLPFFPFFAPFFLLFFLSFSLSFFPFPSSINGVLREKRGKIREKLNTSVNILWAPFVNGCIWSLARTQRIPLCSPRCFLKAIWLRYLHQMRRCLIVLKLLPQPCRDAQFDPYFSD